MQFRQRARGLTLVELLVVLAIIAVLFSLLATGLTRMRRAAQELKSVAQVTRMCDTAIKVYIDLRGEPPPWRRDVNGDIRSQLNQVDGIVPRALDDPFRNITIAADPLLGRLGTFVDADHGSIGFGYLYVPLNASVTGTAADPHSINDLDHPMWDVVPRCPAEPSWTNLCLPDDTEYLLWGVGPDGQLDGDPARDIVLIKTPLNPTLVRHQ